MNESLLTYVNVFEIIGTMNFMDVHFDSKVIVCETLQLVRLFKHCLFSQFRRFKIN